jgi:hypothetical protein
MPTIVRCIYCGVADPDIKSICPDTHTTHVLVSASDKQTQGQGYGPGPGSDNSPYEREKMNQTKSKEAGLSRSLGHGFAQTDTVKHCPFVVAVMSGVAVTGPYRVSFAVLSSRSRSNLPTRALLVRSTVTR